MSAAPEKIVGRILVVEDDESIRVALRDFLGWMGLDVALCERGRDAMAKVENHKPEIVLLDLKMPDMDGVKVLEALRASHPEIAVMLISGNKDTELARRCMEMGACDYFTKPFDLNYLQKSIVTRMFLIRGEHKP